MTRSYFSVVCGQSLAFLGKTVHHPRLASTSRGGFCVHISPFYFPLFIRTYLYWIRAALMTSAELCQMQILYFQIKSYLWVLMVRTQHLFERQNSACNRK